MLLTLRAAAAAEKKAASGLVTVKTLTLVKFCACPLFLTEGGKEE